MRKQVAVHTRGINTKTSYPTWINYEAVETVYCHKACEKAVLGRSVVVFSGVLASKSECEASLSAWCSVTTFHMCCKPVGAQNGDPQAVLSWAYFYSSMHFTHKQGLIFNVVLSFVGNVCADNYNKILFSCFANWMSFLWKNDLRWFDRCFSKVEANLRASLDSGLPVKCFEKSKRERQSYDNEHANSLHLFTYFRASSFFCPLPWMIALFAIYISCWRLKCPWSHTIVQETLTGDKILLKEIFIYQ